MSRERWVERIVGGLNLRFPAVFVLLVVLTALDFVFPDFVPFVDEIGLALLTVLFGLWRKRRESLSDESGRSR
jgi:uncharacterized protein DUF6116